MKQVGRLHKKVCHVGAAAGAVALVAVAAETLPFADREDEDFAARGFIAAWLDALACAALVGYKRSIMTAPRQDYWIN